MGAVTRKLQGVVHPFPTSDLRPGFVREELPEAAGDVGESDRRLAAPRGERRRRNAAVADFGDVALGSPI